MAVVKAFRALHPRDQAAPSTNGSVNLCTSLTGNVDTTNKAVVALFSQQGRVVLGHDHPRQRVHGLRAGGAGRVVRDVGRR